MIDVRVKVDLNKTDRMLKAVQQIARNQKKYKVFRTMATSLLHSWWSETFRKEGRRAGHPPWKPLSAQYKAWKMQQGKGRKIMHFTGHLEGSPEILMETATTMVWGTKVPYAIHHQEPKVPGRPPKREILFITHRDEEEIADFISNFLERYVLSKYES